MGNIDFNRENNDLCYPLIMGFKVQYALKKSTGGCNVINIVADYMYESIVKHHLKCIKGEFRVVTNEK